MTAYLCKVPLSYPTDPDVLARLRRGQPVPWGERQHVHAAAGAVVADLPPTSVPNLLQKGWIEAVPEPPPPKAPTVRAPHPTADPGEGDSHDGGEA